MEKRSIKIAATMSLRPKDFKRTTYAEGRVVDVDQAFLMTATKKLQNDRLVDIDGHCQLDKFEKFHYSVSRKNLALAEEDARIEREQRREFRDTFLQAEREKKLNTTLKMEELTKNWRATQMVKRERVKKDLQFELTTQEMEKLRSIYKRQEAKKDEISGVEYFERNMKKMGISSGEGENTRLSVSYEAADIYEKRLQETLKSKLPTNEETQSFVNQLKERTAEKRQARYEKARRRRRALANIVGQQVAEKEPTEDYSSSALYLVD